jgi:hypothetical protein
LWIPDVLVESSPWRAVRWGWNALMETALGIFVCLVLFVAALCFVVSYSIEDDEDE